MHINPTQISFDQSIENFIRNEFVKEISGVSPELFPRVLENSYVSLFLGSYNTLRHNENEFKKSMYELIELDDNLHRMAQKALNFYETYRLHFTSQVISNQEFDVPFDTLMDQEVIYNNIEEKRLDIEKTSKEIIPLVFSAIEKELINKIIDVSCCVIDFEHLINAVTPACGHSINEASANSLYSLELNGQCKVLKPCSLCPKEVTQFFKNPLLRKVAAKVEELSKSMNDQNATFNEQKGLIAELSGLVTCQTSSTFLTSAVLYQPAETPGQWISFNDIPGIENTIPDYSLRAIAALVQKLNESA